MTVEIAYDVKGVEDLKSSLERFDSGMQRQVHEHLRRWSEEVMASARQKVPVKTGQLRRSIYSKVGEWVAEVGVEAAYAMFVEFGTCYMRAHPFLFPAVQECLPMLESVISEGIEAAKREAGL